MNGITFFPFHLGNRELISLTTEEVMSVFTHLGLGNFVEQVFTSVISGDILSNCDTFEDIQELLKMERARAKTVIKKVLHLRANGVPNDFLIPQGMLIVLIISHDSSLGAAQCIPTFYELNSYTTIK